MIAAAWLGLWAGLSVLAYAIAVVRGDIDQESAIARVLAAHSTKLAHLDSSERERAAARLAGRISLTVAALTGAILTGVIALLWMATR